MSDRYILRAGVTDPIVFTLVAIDPLTEEASEVDLTGVALVDLRMKSEDGETTLSFKTSGAQLAITDAELGEVTFTPTSTDFDGSDEWFSCFLKVTDAGGTITDFPSTGNFEIEVIGTF